ncbi:MAG: zf-HC2 domain-containing protein [Deferribacteres bacterium]|nr:zf-HC2 domain-containing protein [candidate division KSB1 bacterium]MCB9512607.1 zf-HC2 domain-containing protein [Deferribacteres bacterium]
MHCDEIQRYLCDYVDNELPQTLQQVVDEHCEQCIQCKNIIAEYKKTSLLLQLRAVPDPGDTYFENTWNVVTERMRARTLAMPNIALPSQSTSWLTRFMRRPVLAFATAAMVIFVSITGYYLLKDMQNTEEYVDNDIEYIVLPANWQPEPPDFGVVPTSFQPEAEFSAYSRAAIGGIDPISKSAVFQQVESVAK